MIQFNLLPDVKLEYIKARRAKRFVMLIAALVTGLAITVLILLIMVVHVFQRQHLNNLGNDIARDSKAIKETDDIEKILTIQSQLTSLPGLHDKKPVTSRLHDFVAQVTPADISMARLEIDFTESTISITGAANSLITVNKFVDTLKFTEYKSGDVQERAFYEVVMTSFNRDEKGASYSIDLKFKPVIFELIKDDPQTDVNESTQNASLLIPNIVTTRSQTEKPGALFQPLTNPVLQEGTR